MTEDPMLDGITRWTAFESLGGLFQGMNKRPTGKYVLFSDLPALLAAAREEAAEAAMQIGRQIEKDNHAAGLCEPSYLTLDGPRMQVHAEKRIANLIEGRNTE